MKGKNVLKRRNRLAALTAFVVASLLTSAAGNFAQAAPKMKTTETPPSLLTPDRVETRIGTLEYRDGAPTPETAAKVRDDLLYVRGVDAFMNSFPARPRMRSARASTASAPKTTRSSSSPS